MTLTVNVGAAPQALEPVNSKDYVSAMSAHVSSVCVITTAIGGRRFGLTATAVSSVCASPPRLLICVNKSGFSHDRIIEAGHFCVNVLTEDQVGVAELFAGMKGSDVERFAAGAWTNMPSGSPALTGAAAVFDCRTALISDQFTHSVIFGDVVAVNSQSGQDALLYGARRFRSLQKAPSELN
ncbi:flavin reductase family protein [Rhizobium sp. S96]|uniref:flavin reductase family protein n=1 Tax=Rhizobium sp. S96 TaxID=3055140 RepID=UPI0025AADB9E|nr:flavin reductase family protein [Rhizobium sp. S96]MDM9624096.1 flavin reductase family protein [Rhizobium sp. S96]